MTGIIIVAFVSTGDQFRLPGESRDFYIKGRKERRKKCRIEEGIKKM